jgi:hypothetical protein
MVFYVCYYFGFLDNSNNTRQRVGIVNELNIKAVMEYVLREKETRIMETNKILIINNRNSLAICQPLINISIACT